VLTDIILISLWGGIVALDTTAVLQVMISRPIVACTVVGLILGNAPLGFTIGFLLELLYISELHVGAAKFSESNVGSVAAAAIAVLTMKQLPDRSDAVIVLSLILAVLISVCGGALVSFMRFINTRNYSRLLEKRQLKPRHINMAQLAGVCMAFLLGFICVMVTTTILMQAMPVIIRLLPAKYDKILEPAIGGLLAAECVFLAHMFWTQTRRRWIVLLGLAAGLLIIYSRVV
jgi:mannose/fructose/N-acetylgalactosamine-specific phosphotransferase system component IIC